MNKTEKEKTFKRTAIIYWSFTICYMVVIYFFSSLKGHLLPFSIEGFDKILHVIIYAALGFLIYSSFRKSGVRRHVFPLSLLFAAVYGVTDELHQLYVPGRLASFGDIIADFVGVFLGSYAAAVVSSRKT